jgi:hypothetical protein
VCGAACAVLALSFDLFKKTEQKQLVALFPPLLTVRVKPVALCFLDEIFQDLCFVFAQ